MSLEYHKEEYGHWTSDEDDDDDDDVELGNWKIIVISKNELLCLDINVTIIVLNLILVLLPLL